MSRAWIHRDLKPANVKVKADGAVKVLDFGLAKALDPSPTGDPSQSPTLTAAATQQGVIMGTAAYMSPEQAKGKPVDKRADVWAFGCVLFEILTGRKPFVADDVSDTLALVLKFEPEWDALPADGPPRVRQLIQTCLQKDPKQRVHDVADVRLAMEGAFETTVTAPSEAVAVPQLQVWQRPVPALIVMLLVAITGVAVWSLVRPGLPASPPTTRLAIPLPASAPLTMAFGGSNVILSSDGRTLVYIGRGEGGVSQLYRRSMDQLEVSLIPGTADALSPFLSPGGQWVGFLSGDLTSLQRVSLAGGPPLTICECLRTSRPSWGPDDSIVFGGGTRGLFRVSAAGGVPEALTTPADGERHINPVFLPGGRAVLFRVVPASGDAQLTVFAVDTGEQQVLNELGDVSYVVGFSSGHIMFARDDSLWAVPFDVERLEVVGTPSLVLEGVAVIGPLGVPQVDVARDGTLVYIPGDAVGAGTRTLVWADRDGREEPLSLPPVRRQTKLDTSAPLRRDTSERMAA